MSLAGIGSIAGGISQGLGPYLQAYEQQLQTNNVNTAVGEAIYAKYGVTPPTQQSGMGALFPQTSAQAAPQQTSISPPPQTQISAPPSMGQGGVAQSPVPTLQPSQPLSITPPSQVTAPPLSPGTAPDLAPPTTPGSSPSPVVAQPPQTQASPLPKGAPQTAVPGSLGTQATPPAGPQPQSQAQPQFQQQDQLRPDQPQTVQQNLDKYKGMFDDYNLLSSNLLKTPGMTPLKLGRIVNSRGFENMLTQQGLAAYRAAGLGIRQENTDISGQRLGAL